VALELVKVLFKVEVTEVAIMFLLIRVTSGQRSVSAGEGR